MKVWWAYSASRDHGRAAAASRIRKRSVTAERAGCRGGERVVVAGQTALAGQRTETVIR
jgi:hypothetical protein